jgi:uroporphyrinogen III methyltransferase/synthase
LEKWGLLADLIADEHVAEGLARQLLLAGPAQRALLVRALEARDALPKALEAAGLRVDVVAAYETRTLAQAQSPTLKTLLESGNVDAVLLTSSSMAESLIEALGPEASTYLSKLCVASIGPITTATLERLGVPVSVTANTYTVAGLLDALETYYLGG